MSSESTKASPKARKVRGIVTDRREAISGPTGRVLTKEFPRSRVIMPRNQVTNCSPMGRSAPTCARAAAICSGVALIDRSALAGSPGRARRSRKMTTIATSNETTRMMVRRTRYWAMSR